MSEPVIYWFRRDLRVDDLPALNAAAATEAPLIALYVLDKETPGEFATGRASRWWLHHSLEALAADLENLGGNLVLRRGRAAQIIPELVAESGAGAVYCSRGYDPWDPALEQTLHRDLGERDVAFRRYPGSLLFEPESIQTKAGEPYKVFTPFWKACLRAQDPPAPRQPGSAMRFHESPPEGLSLDELALAPRNPNWAASWTDLWQPGATGARAALRRFLHNTLGDYAEGRDFPHRDSTSRLSPHLHFGEISPRQVWHAVENHCAGSGDLAGQRDKFLAELGWREFSHHLLYHFPATVEEPFKPAFARFPWLGTDTQLRAWRRGLTGYPLVDAGMRELWQTGYMHNRVRMITASFLTKHLLIHWRRGEAWFRDTLVDADLANNVCGWQWVAGSGADAAPYFRIFNPTLQSRKFDKEGAYLRRWLPELAALPDKHIHEPSAAPETVLREAGVTLGESYPRPLVEHAAARESALAAYNETKDK